MLQVGSCCGCYVYPHISTQGDPNRLIPSLKYYPMMQWCVCGLRVCGELKKVRHVGNKGNCSSEALTVRENQIKIINSLLLLWKICLFFFFLQTLASSHLLVMKVRNKSFLILALLHCFWWLSVCVCMYEGGGLTENDLQGAMELLQHQE